MNEQTKVKFTLGIGYAGAEHEAEFTLEELGYDPEVDTDIDKFLADAWAEWHWEHVESTWKIEEIT